MCRAQKRLLLLDYDGTLVPQSVINSRPTEEALHMLQGLCADSRNAVYIISGRRKTELAEWFANVVRPTHSPRRGELSCMSCLEMHGSPRHRAERGHPSR